MMLHKIWKITTNKNLEFLLAFEKEFLLRFVIDFDLHKNHNNLLCFNIDFILFGVQLNLSLYEETETDILQ